jgi:L-galactose dehydrogenase
MSNTILQEEFTKVPRRPFCSARLPSTVSIVGLGCSSFSKFFWSQDEENAHATNSWTMETLLKSHPIVQEWIETIQYAILDAGITLLDTAPWYGHGTSEIVIGWALEDLQTTKPNFRREAIQVNTKVGRYNAEPSMQFDFSRDTTMASVQRSLDRMKCGYIDVLQLHDPEFSPSLDELFNETLPAMVECRTKGLCRALGMTGYPLEVQHFLLQRSLDTFGENIWDQALTYSHFNLHDDSLVTKSLGSSTSYLDFCRYLKVEVLAAAPLSMGLLTHQGPPEWHPAPAQLQQACREASKLCHDHGVDISTMALLFALSDQRIPCTILGMKNVDEVRCIQLIAKRVGSITDGSLSQSEILASVLNEKEKVAWQLLRDYSNGPFAKVASNGLNKWNGIALAMEFYRQQGKDDVGKWHSDDNKR